MELTTVLAIFFFVIGLYLTMRGGDAFVESASFIAEITGIPKIIIGATIVSIATTSPELLVSLLATLQGANDMAAGNAIGSVCCNTGLIMGVSLLCLPGVLPLQELRVKGTILFAACIVLGASCAGGVLAFPGCLALLGLCALFFWMNIQGAANHKCHSNAQLRPSAAFREKLINGIKFLLGAAAVLLGAHLMVTNGSLLARLFGVPEGIIGLTLVALGTSLPELITTISAIRRHEAAMSVGNIIGANVIDLTLVPALCAFASQGALEVQSAVCHRDTPIALILAAFALLPAMRTGRFHHWQGAALLAVYLGYIAVLLFGA